jgi:hypothetical protein
VPLFHQSIAVADTAGFDFDAHLPRFGLRGGALDDLKICSGLADLNGFHGDYLSVADGMKLAMRILRIFLVGRHHVSRRFTTVDKKERSGDAIKSKLAILCQLF